MDLPDIKVVIQWKATCDLCTLWQQFGRAARGPGQEATAILFVEKKDTDEERALKAVRAAGRLAKKTDTVMQKRKAEKQLTSVALKRATLGDGIKPGEQASSCAYSSSPREAMTLVLGQKRDMENQQSSANSPSDGGVALDPREHRHAHYQKRPVANKTTAREKKRVNVEVGSPMDDYINAGADHDGIDCRRIVPMLFFENDKRCKCYLHCFLLWLELTHTDSKRRPPAL
jgi:ATP-dependent DNA helicase RecQ